MFRVWTMCSRLVGLIAPLSLFAFRMTWPAVCQLDGLSTLSMWSGFSRYAHITGLPIPMDVFTVGAVSVPLPLGRKGIWALRAAFRSIFFAYWLDILGGLSSGLVESLCYVRAVVRDILYLATFRTF